MAFVSCTALALAQPASPTPTPRPYVQPQQGQPNRGVPGQQPNAAEMLRAQERAKQAVNKANQPPNQPQPLNANPQAQSAPIEQLASVGDGEMVTLSAFTEPVQLTSLVDLVATTLQINVTIKGDLPGSVVFNAPIPVQKKDLLELLDSLLDQQGWTIVQDKFGMYNVQPAGEIRPVIGGDKPTTRVIGTPNIRPSAIKPAIDAQFGNTTGAPSNVQKYTYIDELGVIIATDSPRKLSAFEDFVKTILTEFNRAQFIRLPLTHISAPVARERALQLVGQAAQTQTFPGQPNVQQQPNPGGPGLVGSLNNLGDRLTVDPQGNALIFRGLPDEIANIDAILKIIDRTNELVPKQYFAGSAAKQVADIARSQGLGEVTTIAAATDQFQQQQFQGFDPNTGQFTQQKTSVGGPVMVVDEGRGTIIYYGTPEQQERLAALIKELDTKSERITIEVYKLRNSKAEDVAEVINNLISGSQPLGQAPLLPGGSSGVNPRQNLDFQNFDQGGQQGGKGSGLAIDTSGFVIGDVKNNQIIVKSKAGQQAEFEKLISKLDLRRPQVYIEAKIVAVTADERLRYGFETQLINANGRGGVLNSNFGLGSFPTTGSQPILNPKTVGTGFGGFTAAIIKNDQIPIIMTALANETESRIISTPQLLVDDNEEASVVSVDEQPTTSISRGSGTSSDIVTAGAPAEAGTRLTVTPQISEAGYLKLSYEIELSSFTGEAVTVGNTVLPPPKQTNTIGSASITVPSDCTVVVGGLVVNANTNSVAKIPLLGDIPIFGKLFSDTRKGDRQTRLYVFLTPRILRDPGFEDLRLLTRGPQALSRLDPDVPDLFPTSIDIRDPSPVRALPDPAREEIPALTPAPIRTNSGEREAPVVRPVTRVPEPRRAPRTDPLPVPVATEPTTPRVEPSEPNPD